MINCIIHGNCIDLSNNIEDGSVDLILTDLPYGIMQPSHNGKAYKKMYKDKLKWDYAIDPSEIFKIANRILRKNGKMVLFSQEPYSSNLITSAVPNVPYSYKMIWEKDTFGSHLKSNIAPLGYFEEILVFSKKECHIAKHPLREVMSKYVDKYGENKIINLLFEEGRYSSFASARVHAAHKFGFNKGKRFDFMDEKMYKFLSDQIDFNETYEQLKEIDVHYKQEYASTFNLWDGNKYKSNILKYKKDRNGYHPTQKPVLLLEDLIKTFSNNGDIVVDLTIGSGSTAVASIQTNRNYIGFELDEEYCNIANERIEKHKFVNN